ncbi:hypothetical protein I8H83_00095 [Candidatus Saccharibacteria bacterium]|nr:hypothetical protein [Candidatus Saccharibacteria bacterium]
MRLLISCKADARALDFGLEQPRTVFVFTDDELKDRKKGTLTIISSISDENGNCVINYDGGQAFALSRSDDIGYDLVFPSTPDGVAAQEKFIELMEALPLERGVLV